MLFSNYFMINFVSLPGYKASIKAASMSYIFLYSPLHRENSYYSLISSTDSLIHPFIQLTIFFKDQLCADLSAGFIALKWNFHFNSWQKENLRYSPQLHTQTSDSEVTNFPVVAGTKFPVSKKNSCAFCCSVVGKVKERKKQTRLGRCEFFLTALPFTEAHSSKAK